MTLFQFFNKFSRTTSSIDLIKEVDGLRFLAIAPVILLHLTTAYLRQTDHQMTSLVDQIAYYIIERGAIGVNIFFVLSGFVLALPFANHYLNEGKEISIRQFYLRRVTRLEPPFVISLTLFFFGLIVVSQGEINELIKSYAASLFYLHYLLYGAWSIVNPVTWSLETEVQFYLLAPLIFLLFKIKRRDYRFTLILIACLIVSFFRMSYPKVISEFHLGKSLLVYLPYFLTGMVLCELYYRSRIFNSDNKTFTWDCIGLAALIGAYFMHYNYNWFGSIAQCTFIAMVFIASFRGKFLNVIFTNNKIVIIGGMCYSLYLLHYGVIAVIVPLVYVNVGSGFLIDIVIQSAIVIPIVLIISAIFFLFFEKPFMYKNWYKDFPKGYLSRLFQ